VANFVLQLFAFLFKNVPSSIFTQSVLLWNWHSSKSAPPHRVRFFKEKKKRFLLK